MAKDPKDLKSLSDVILASETMFLGLSNVLANLSYSVNRLNEDLASGISKVLKNTDALGANFISPIGPGNLSKSLEKLFAQSNTQFVIPVQDASNINKSLQDLVTKPIHSLLPGVSEFHKVTKRTSTLEASIPKVIIPKPIDSSRESQLLIPEIIRLSNIFESVGDKIVKAIHGDYDIDEKKYHTLGPEKEVGPIGFNFKSMMSNLDQGVKKEGIWSGLEAGSLSGMVRGLISDIKEYKAVAILTTITTAAMLHEFDINKVRVFTDNLGIGAKTLENFKSAAATVAVSLGEDFGEIANRAAVIHKDMNLAFDSESFSKYLMIQGKIIKATQLSGDTLNKLFLTVKIGSKTETEFITVSEQVGKTLIALAGKAGITQEGLDKFAKSLAAINLGMAAAGVSQTDMLKTQTQLGRGLEAFGKAGTIGETAWNKLTAALSGAREFDDVSIGVLTRLGVGLADVDKAFQTSNFEGIISTITRSISEFSKPGISNFKYLEGIFDSETARVFQALSKQGKLTFLDDLRKDLNKPLEASRLKEILGSIGESLKAIKSAFGSFLVSIGEAPLYALSIVLRGIAFLLKSIHETFQLLPGSIKTVISSIVGLSLGAWAAVGVIRLLALAFKGLSAAMALVGLGGAAGVLGRIAAFLGAGAVVTGAGTGVAAGAGSGIASGVAGGAAGAAGGGILARVGLGGLLARAGAAVGGIFAGGASTAAAGATQLALPLTMAGSGAAGAGVIGTAAGVVGGASIIPVIGWIVAGIIAIGTASFLVYKHWDSIKTLFSKIPSLLSGIGPFISNIGKSLSSTWNDMLLNLKIKMIDTLISIKETWQKVHDWWAGLTWDDVTSPFVSAWNTSINFVKEMWEKARTWMSELSWSKMEENFQKSNESMKETMLRWWKSISEGASNWWKTLGKSVEDLKKEKTGLERQQIQKIMPAGVAIPENIGKPKDFMQSIEAMKNVGVRMVPGTNIPEMVNKITTANYGSELTSFMSRIKGYEEKNVKPELVQEFYNKGFEGIRIAAAGGMTRDQLKTSLEGLKINTAGDGKVVEEKGPINVNGVDDMTKFLKEIKELLEKQNQRSDSSNVIPLKRPFTDQEVRSGLETEMYRQGLVGSNT